MTNFIQLTRVFKFKGAEELQTQKITVAASSVALVRPSNRLTPGDLEAPAHRSSITLNSGAVIDLAEKYSVVADLLADAA